MKLGAFGAALLLYLSLVPSGASANDVAWSDAIAQMNWCVEGCAETAIGCGDCIGEPAAAVPFSLQQWLTLSESRYFITGHIQQGLNANARNPTNPPGGTGNSPAGGLVYRTGYLLNQVYLSAGRVADTSTQPLAIGYQADMIFGTDYVFMQSRGLEQFADGTNRWNPQQGSGFLGQGRYGLAMPQLFLEVAYEDVSVKIGHFYNLLGHEDLIPTENFFYTSAYPLFFNGLGESRPVTGVYGQWSMSPQWRSGAGFHRGQGNWEDNNDNLNTIGMLEWNNRAQTVFISYSFDIGKEDDLGENLLYAQSLIFKWQLREHLGYVLHTSYGFEENTANDGTGTAHWYGTTHYLAHRIDEQWVCGIRYDLFDDVHGTRVFPRAGGPNDAPGVYQAITLGLNYAPCASVRVRPEVRWDWFSPDGTLPPGPYDNGNSRDQFMAAVDMIYNF